MKRKFKLIFFLTLFLFFILILSDAFLKVEFNNDSWYSLAIMFFFFSFSFFQVQILEKNINRGASFVKVYLILTIAKILCSAFFIISYGMLKADEAEPRFLFGFLFFI